MYNWEITNHGYIKSLCVRHPPFQFCCLPGNGFILAWWWLSQDIWPIKMNRYLHIRLRQGCLRIPLKLFVSDRCNMSLMNYFTYIPGSAQINGKLSKPGDNALSVNTWVYIRNRWQKGYYEDGLLLSSHFVILFSLKKWFTTKNPA